MKAIEKRGGARAGAGAPPTLAKQLKEAKSLAKRLRQGMAGGWEYLSDEYVALMKVAIGLAKGEVLKDGKVVLVIPNSLVLMRLLELLPKVAGEDSEKEDSPIQRIMKELKANVINIQVNSGQDVGSDGKESPVRVEHYTVS